MVDGPDADLTCTQHESIAIGAAEDNDVVLTDPTVSRYHVEVSPGPEGILVRDLGSLNGVRIGDLTVECATVPTGTHIALGATVLLLTDSITTERPMEQAPTVPGLVFKSRAMRHVALLVTRLAESDASVLLSGETGTGKEVVARAIHQLSARKAEPFVVVDCGSLPPTLVASELFGHEKGAFTGAHRRHVGAFERARGGTLLLDEIGELPVELQPALLGVLERKVIRRVGGESDIPVDVRVLCATHRDLRALTNTGAFRPDLYFRIAVTRVPIPPLRQRPEDVEPLARHFTEELLGPGIPIPLDAATLESLRHHPWAGNVRELRNVIEGAIAMGGLEPLTPEPQADEPRRLASYREARALAIAEFERRYLSELIESCDGNASEAARRASMDRPYLLTLLRRHGLR